MYDTWGCIIIEMFGYKQVQVIAATRVSETPIGMGCTSDFYCSYTYITFNQNGSKKRHVYGSESF